MGLNEEKRALDNHLKEDTEISQEDSKKKKVFSLKKMLTALIISGWLIPVIIIFIAMTISYREGIIHKTEVLLKDELKLFTTLTAFKLDEAITMSKELSYDKSIENTWRKLSKEAIDKSQFYKEASSIMRSKFYTNPNFGGYMFYLTDEPTIHYPNTMENAQYMTGRVMKKANEISLEDDPSAHVVVIDGEVYIIRNMYTISGYTKYGTMVLALNKKNLFAEVDGTSLWDLSFFVNNTSYRVTNTASKINEDEMDLIITDIKKIYSRDNKNKITPITGERRYYEGYLNEQKFKDYHLGVILVAETSRVYSELNVLNKTIVLILLFIFPIFLYVLYFNARHITSPIDKMVAVYKRLKKGEIGITLEEDPMPNQEFEYLRVAFNKMSKEIEYAFQYAYNEQLARKDAKIMALQSQINPHFLNNTLEMMNWQARMSGDINVSKMIEALSTLLDYSMDRSNKRLISLADEIRCADAYFYIISMRFGQRLMVKREIDESLLYLQVPQLILQPLLENAVTHGIETVNKGTISMYAYREGENVILQVINTGKGMTQEDVERVDNLLNGRMDQIPQGQGKHISLGIRNVNERIKLIYGEQYGLTIKPRENGETASTITIPYEESVSIKGEIEL